MHSFKKEVIKEAINEVEQITLSFNFFGYLNLL